MFSKKQFLFLLLAMLLSFHSSAFGIEYNWQDVKGQHHTLKSFAGKPTILHFWASWCPPCKKEMPELAAWMAQHPEVQVIPISLDANLDKASDYLKLRQLAMPALRGDQSKALQLGIYALPISLLVDAKGRLVRKEIGAKPWSDPDYSLGVMKLLGFEKIKKSNESE
ncbi:MAG: TlpA disulfide reductase family protein [Mariprofundaceae bacterium]|nr:TlpA disulfide reductase family protein [Mariprofundaceae bacterium]